MKSIPVLAFVALLGLGACDQIENDPDIQEARTAIRGAIKDEGKGVKQVYNEVRSTRDDEAPADDHAEEPQERR